jgi:mannose-6-phosphate isomerase-like protein (cupin superfamily)
MKPMRQLAVLAALLVAVVLLAGAGTTPKVTYLDAPEVEAAFAKGMPLLETASYKIHASRREAPGEVEIHEVDTDIIYVLDGKATIVTGGEMLDGKTTATSEIRGSSIRGGETRTLAKGDVMVVPSGTPHWFREVEGPFLYYVVKVPRP